MAACIEASLASAAPGRMWGWAVRSQSLSERNHLTTAKPMEIFWMTTQETVAVFLCATLALACTSITVQPVDASAGLQHVCIKENPKVLVSDFVPVVRSGLSRHGISSRVYSDPLPEECEFILTYTALRTWDL
jgi:hypothetical protein